MRLDVRGLRKAAGSRLEAPLTVALAPADLSDDVVSLPDPISGRVEAVSSGGGIIVRVQAKGQAELWCARCLTPFRHPIRIDFAEAFRQRRAALTDDDGAEDFAADAYLEYDGDVIELDEPVRQQFLLELPMKPLCRPDCRGLCTRCGANLNSGPCQCPAEADPRLAALSEWVERRRGN